MNSETFLLSNMVPQLPGLNRAGWLGLENRERKWTDQTGELYIYTGVLFQGDRISTIGNSVPVPTHFYKIMYDPKRERAIAFLLPHRRILTRDLDLYLVSVDQVEERTGFDFLSNLSDSTEEVIEAKIPRRQW